MYLMKISNKDRNKEIHLFMATVFPSESGAKTINRFD